jgi:hypothetical protein
MRRFFLSILILGVSLALLGSARAQEPIPKHVVKSHRQATFAVKNDTGESRVTPSVRANGSLPIRFDVTDDGFGRERKLQLFVAVHKRPHPNHMIPGDLVKTYLGPEAMVSPASGSRTLAATADVPLPKGEYLFYVFLCDPDYPVDKSATAVEAFKKYEEMPGRIMKAKLCVLHVD